LLVLSPPWGQKVVEALNLIAAKSPYINDASKTEFQKSKEAVTMVLTAFQKQMDEELSARLGRKNCQVMDRLAMMQAYKREAVMLMRGSYGLCMLATKAANKFHGYAKENRGSTGIDTPHMTMSLLPASDQVPLLACRVMFGGSAGMCYVTYHELLLVTQSIPLLGGNHFSLVLLNQITLEIQSSGKKSRLNPVPSVVLVKRKSNGTELFSFRPSAGAHLFKDFVDAITNIAQESPEAVNFSSQGGLMNLFDEKASFAKAALGGEPEVD